MSLFNKREAGWGRIDGTPLFKGWHQTERIALAGSAQSVHWHNEESCKLLMLCLFSLIYLADNE